MNHMLGANTPLLRVQLQPSTLTLEHIVGAKIAATLHASLLASSFNGRNSHWEPLFETWQLDANVLHKTAAAVSDGSRSPLNAEYIGLDARCSPLSLNVTP